MLLRPNQANACRAQEARLEDYLEGRLDGREKAAVESHLRSCARCGAALGSARRSLDLLGALPAPLASASPGFVTRVMAAIAGGRQRLESWKPVEVAAWRLCWVATAAVLLLAAALMKVQMSAPPMPVTPQSQVQSLVSVPLPQPVGTDDTVLLVAREDDVR